MRSLAVVLLIPLIACGSAAGGPSGDTPDAHPPDGDAGVITPPDAYFTITSPTFDIAAGTDITYCYYFHTANTADMAIKRWTSHMTDGGHDLILYLTPTDLMPVNTTINTMSPQCGIANGTTGPIWTYAATTPDAQVMLPADDGTGHPISQTIGADHPAFLQMHFINNGTATIHPHVEINAYAYDDSVTTTEAGTFVSLNLEINLPAAPTPSMPMAGKVSGDCMVAAEPNLTTPKFFGLTTYTHRLATHTFVKDGATTVFDSTSWAAPGETTWSAPAFYSFTSGMLSYQCEYSNTTQQVITSGDDPTTREACMTIGYYFPAAKGHFCLDSTMLF